MGVLRHGKDNCVGRADGLTERRDGLGCTRRSVGLEEGDFTETGEYFNLDLGRREQRSRFQQKQIGGAGAEAAGDGEDAEGRAHKTMIAGAGI